MKCEPSSSWIYKTGLGIGFHLHEITQELPRFDTRFRFMVTSAIYDVSLKTNTMQYPLACFIHHANACTILVHHPCKCLK